MLKIIHLIPVVFLVLLSGCTIPEKLEITNNTDQLVVVKFEENSFRIAPKESAIVGEGFFMEFTIYATNKN